jgi:ribonuclease HI
MKGIYQCASPNLVSLYERAKELENNFEKIKYEHVLRHLNKRADYLSNVAIMDYKP